jgi:ectoine hydroxylase-related dioxygenase (phytanoyl-CoA dioxygenase family)
MSTNAAHVAKENFVMVPLNLRPHPWSTGFEWSDHQGPFGFLKDDQVQRFDEEGFIVVEDLFTREELKHVVDELDVFDVEMDRRLDRESARRAGISEKGAISFIPNLVARSEIVREFVRHSKLLGIAADILGPDVNLYWEQAVYKKPEKPRRFPLHQDTGYQLTDPEDFLSCWIPLNDATVDNGCPQIAPGLHVYGTLAHTYVEPLGWECLSESPPEVVAAPVRAGGAVVFSSLAPHFTGPNTTDDIRKAYVILYARKGTVAYVGAPVGSRPEPVQQDNPDYQFAVLRGGRAV